MENVTDIIVFFIVYKDSVFSFCFYRNVGLEVNIEYTKKKVLRQPWNALVLQVSLSLCDKLHRSEFKDLKGNELFAKVNN